MRREDTIHNDPLLLSIDADHRALARLIERIACICDAREARDCKGCGTARESSCEAAMFEASGEMLGMMLEHFEREDALMRALPNSPRMQRHCEAHRDEHAQFSSRYNRLARDDHPSLAKWIAAWERLVHDWTREHALRYDAELMKLVREARA